METEMDLEMVFLALTDWDLLVRKSCWIKCLLVKGTHKPIPADFRQIVTKNATYWLTVMSQIIPDF